MRHYPLGDALRHRAQQDATRESEAAARRADMQAERQARADENAVHFARAQAAAVAFAATAQNLNPSGSRVVYEAGWRSKYGIRLMDFHGDFGRGEYILVTESGKLLAGRLRDYGQSFRELGPEDVNHGLAYQLVGAMADWITEAHARGPRR